MVARLVLITCVILVGCGSTQAPPPKSAEVPPTASADAAAPTPPAPAPPAPGGATRSELESVPAPPPPEPPPAPGTLDAGEGWTTPDVGASTYGYRVQIFATADEVRAKQVASEARSRFAEPVYVQYEVPLYKVRVGDCVTRGEVDALKERAVALGYDGAWIAETTVQAR